MPEDPWAINAGITDAKCDRLYFPRLECIDRTREISESLQVQSSRGALAKAKSSAGVHIQPDLVRCTAVSGNIPRGTPSGLPRLVKFSAETNRRSSLLMNHGVADSELVRYLRSNPMELGIQRNGPKVLTLRRSDPVHSHNVAVDLASTA